ncbi:MAG: helix-turn-helix domain-containing protein [Nanoarchaeota archaeon]|nr:helix-turn-helix domain-containing protein [Nanoarchaeota archaeon]
MLVKQELINKIKDYFGLNVYETKVWLALLGKGVASAGEIAEISRVPRSRTYDVLETLEKKGFTIIKIGKPVKYIGVKPQIILERLKNDVKRDAQERLDYLLKIKETDEFGNLEEIYKGGINPVDRGDLSVALKGKTNISGYLREIIKKAEKEIIICTDVEEIKSKIKIFQQMLSVISQSKIKLKIALSGDEESIKKVEKILGIKVKKVDLSAKFFIIDRKEILFYLSKNSSDEDSAIWLNSEFFSQAFAALFEKAFSA